MARRMITQKKTLELRSCPSSRNVPSHPSPNCPPSSPLKVGLHSPPPQTATSLHDVATRGPCQVPPAGLGRRARTKLVRLLMAGGAVHHGSSASLQIPGEPPDAASWFRVSFLGGGLAGCRAEWQDGSYSPRCASPFSGVFWVPEGGIPHWRWTLDAGDDRGGPISAWCLCCCFQEAAAAAALAHGEVVSAGCRIDVQGMGVARGRGGI